MQNILDIVDELSVEFKKNQPLKHENKIKLDKKFRLEFNYNSNHLEGNTLTYSETQLLLFFDETKGSHTLREYEEMKAHDVAFALVKEWAEDKELPLTETNIKNLNEVILVKPFWKEAITPDGQSTRRLIKIGNYKDQPNSVRLSNGEIFEYTSVANTPIEMQELIDWYRSEENNIHPVTLAAMLHYKFVRIHPFDDGNGRVSRLLMNYVLLRNNLPPVVIKSDDKANYLRALHEADTGNFEPFITYIGEQLVWSLKLSIIAAKGESIEEPDDLDKEIYLLKKELKGEDVLKTSASSEIICDTIEQNIIPLFIMIEEKCEEFKEFFFNVGRRVEFEIDGETGAKTIGTKDSKWDVLKQNWLNDKVRADKKRLRLIRYSYELKGFKKNASANSIWLNLEVFFSEYNYEIKLRNSNDNAPIPYEKKMDGEELRNYVIPLIKEIIESVKRFNNSN